MASRFWRVAMVALLIFGTACASNGPVVKFESSASPIRVNDTSQVAIKVENISNLIAFEAHLSFDPNVVEVTGLNNGGFISADFVVQNSFDNTAGTIDFAVAQVNHPPANGDGVLFEIAFQAKAGGKSPILFRPTQAVPEGVLLSDPNGIAIQVTLTDGSISVNE
jgi:hypothetical protein